MEEFIDNEKLAETPEHHERYFPRDIYETHPELAKGETVQLPHDTVLTVDFLGYSVMMSHEEYLDEAVEVMNEFEDSIIDIAEELGLDIVKEAGDEIMVKGRISFMNRIKFGLKAQKANVDIMKRHERIEQLLIEKKNIDPPHVHVGIDSPDPDQNDHIMMKQVDLGDRTDLMIMGNVLLAKDLAEGYMAHTTREPLPLTDIITLADRPVPSHLRTLEEAGLIVTEHKNPDSPDLPSYFTIEVPPTDQIDDIIHNITRLEAEATTTSTVETVKLPEKRESTLNEQTANRVAQRMSPLYLRGETGVSRPDHAEDVNHEGEAYFGFVNGIGDLKKTLDENKARIMKPGHDRLESNYALMEVVAETSAFIASKTAHDLVDAGGNMKETEFNSKYTLKILGFGDGVYSRSGNYQGELTKEYYEAALNTVRMLETEEFKDELMKHLMSKIQLDMDWQEIEEIVRNNSFYSHAGLSSCEANNLNWTINEQPSDPSQNKPVFKGGDNVRGSLLTAAGRFVSHIFEKRHEETVQQYEDIGDPETAQIIRDLKESRKGYLTMQRQVAERLGIAEQAIVSLNNMKSKGYDHPFDILVFRP